MPIVPVHNLTAVPVDRAVNLSLMPAFPTVHRQQEEAMVVVAVEQGLVDPTRVGLEIPRHRQGQWYMLPFGP